MQLVVFDTKTARVTSSTPVLFEPFHMPFDVAITEAADGSISAFFNAFDAAKGVRPYFGEIHSKTGAFLSSPGSFPHLETRVLTTAEPDWPAAMVVWGGARWLFTGDPATQAFGRSAQASMLTRLPVNGPTPEIIARAMPFLVVGAGLVACEGGLPIR